MVEQTQQVLEAAFEHIEGAILPGLSMMLDTLIDAAALGQPGIDSAVYAAELRTIALQLEDLTRQVEAMSPPYPTLKDYKVVSAA